MGWSPQDAMKAYLHTLQLVENEQDSRAESRKLTIEPKCTEFVSALAAGKRTRLMLQVTAEGITPLTIALAVAAKQIGGGLVCILIQREHVDKSRAQLIGKDLHDVVELVDCDNNPFEVIKNYLSIDFAVIDCKFEHPLKFYKILNLNPCGSTVVANNLKPNRGERVNPLVEILKAGKQGVESVTLPIEEGIELTRFGSTCKRQQSMKYRRFHVTFEI